MPEIEAGEARELFGEARVARLATVDVVGRPHLVPVVFALARRRRSHEPHDAHGPHGPHDQIVTAVDWKPKRTARPRRLSNIAARPAVCLLVDEYDDDWRQLWWARADGNAHIVAPDAAEEPVRDEYDAAVRLLRRKYDAYRRRPPGGPVIVVSVVRWSGWRMGDGDPDVTGP